MAAAHRRTATMLLIVCAMVPNHAEFGAREGVVTNLHDEAGGDTPLLAVVRRAWQHLQALDGRKYENRTAAGFDREVLPRLGFGTPGGPSQFRTCSCCCCDPLVTGISVFERPSEKLDTLLSKHGVEGCHELAAARMAVDSKIIHKSAGGHIIRHGSLRGQPVVIVTCGSRGCASKGVGTMLAKRQSPFVVDLVGYCPPGGTGFPSGALVMEQMTSGGHRWMGVAYPWAWAFDNSAGMPAGPVKLQLLNVALGIIGGMKDYHSLGRLGADIGPHQWMGSADGRVKIMDVDCRPEAYVQNIIWSSRDEKDKFTRTNEANPNYKDSCPKPDRSQWWSNGRQLDATQRRDVVLVAILLCNLLPPQRETCLDRGSTAHDLGVGHGERHGRCDAKVELSSTQVKRLQRLYQRAHNKGDLDIRLDDLVSEFVDVLGLSGVIEGSARF